MDSPTVKATKRSHARLDILMVLLALLSILLIWVQDRATDPEVQRRLLYIDLAIVAIFILEYLGRLVRSKDRAAFVRANWYELPGMIPIFPGMEAYGSMRLLRLLRVLRILRLLGALRRFEAFENLVDRFIRRSKIGYIALGAAIIIFSCAGVAFIVDGETFPSYGDALWWSIVTATTVGYGDYYPHTVGGRLVGVVLMILGVTLIGTLAATLGSFLIERRFGSNGSTSLAGELERLAKLHREGQLSTKEFEDAKKRLLQ